jgi:hypothetical protein
MPVRIDVIDSTRRDNGFLAGQRRIHQNPVLCTDLATMVMGVIDRANGQAIERLRIFGHGARRSPICRRRYAFRSTPDDSRLRKRGTHNRGSSVDAPRLFFVGRIGLTSRLPDRIRNPRHPARLSARESLAGTRSGGFRSTICRSRRSF